MDGSEAIKFGNRGCSQVRSRRCLGDVRALLSFLVSIHALAPRSFRETTLLQGEADAQRSWMTNSVVAFPSIALARRDFPEETTTLDDCLGASLRITT